MQIAMHALASARRITTTGDIADGDDDARGNRQDVRHGLSAHSKIKMACLRPDDKRYWLVITGKKARATRLQFEAATPDLGPP